LFTAAGVTKPEGVYIVVKIIKHMLKIFNELRPFFEDVFREISIREYAREVGISPPTASKILKEFEKEGLLISNQVGIYTFFRADSRGHLFSGLSKLYWQSTLHELTEGLHEEIGFGRIILFGSIAKSENTRNSDIDIYIDANERQVDISKLESALKRPIQLHFKKELKNEGLRKNIESGIRIR
jgi:predicted nucleotidyltransferase